MLFFLEQLHVNLSAFSTKISFHIGNEEFTYARLGERIACIQEEIGHHSDEQVFGVMTHNLFDTYATIFALWLSGKTSVPLGTKVPHARNQHIVNQVGIRVIFDASGRPQCFDGAISKTTSELNFRNNGPKYHPVAPETDLYLLFTSGSTGLPKGVRISRENFNAYLTSFFACGYQIDETDRCLQLFELTFDASAQCYTFPLLKGATVFTLPDEGPKFLSMYKILKEQEITFAKMTPSAIYYLQPYFGQIVLPKLRYCLFGAEAFPVQLVRQWEKCVPNAIIHNVYGPTELTINCAYYSWKKDTENKSYNGIASIGRPYASMKAIVVNDQLELVPPETTGELCFSGPQTSKGYWKSPENDYKAFFSKTIDGNELRFYRTGDLGFIDRDGDIFFSGRLDTQVQIDGFRVELGEIENHAYRFTQSRCLALSAQKEGLARFIVLFVESEEIDKEAIMAHLEKNLPYYMLPRTIELVHPFPLLPSGKLDRQKLLSMIDNPS